MHASPSPTARAYPFLDHDGPLAFAHRGGAAYADNVGVENSMAAFQTAVDLGYRYLETDVQVTADGQVVAFHDPSLRRLTGVPHRVADVTFADLSRSRVGGREPIPRLSDLLGTWPQVRVNIDVKTDRAVEPLAAVLRRRPGDLDRVCVASFSEARIRRVRRLLGPRVATACGPVSVAVLRVTPLALLRRLLLAAPVPCLQVPWLVGRLELVTPRFVRWAHDLGKHVHVWTVDEAPQMHTLLDRGVDGIMTDRIDTLREVLSARGQWPVTDR